MIGLEKATTELMNIAASENDVEKKETFTKAAIGLTVLLSLPGDIENYIQMVSCREKENQKWFKFGAKHIQNVVENAISEVDE